MNDLFSDCIARLKIAAAAGHREALLPAAPTAHLFLKLLWDEGLIYAYELAGEGRKLRVLLAYDEHGGSPLRALRRVSTPGRRVRLGYAEILRRYGRCGFVVLSTPPHGYITLRELRSPGTRQKSGGEVIAIWGKN